MFKHIGSKQGRQDYRTRVLAFQRIFREVAQVTTKITIVTPPSASRLQSVRVIQMIIIVNLGFWRIIDPTLCRGTNYHGGFDN